MGRLSIETSTICISVQSPNVALKGLAVLSVASASGHDEADDLRENG
jgi:hypothetical protein